MKILKYMALLMSAFWLAQGCSDEIIPSLPGDMIGYVLTFDEFGNLQASHEDVTVTIFGSDGGYSATTDEWGRFQASGLPTGTYEIHFEKEGYGTLKQFSVKHLGGQPTILGLNDDWVYFMYEIPATRITNLVLNNDTAYAEFQFTKSPEPSDINLRLYFSDSPDFSEDSQKYTSDFRIGVNGPNWNAWHPENLPFDPGSMVYYKAAMNTKVSSIYPNELNLYTFSSYYQLSGISTYYDINLKQTIIPNIGDETEVNSFVLPD